LGIIKDTHALLPFKEKVKPPPSLPLNRGRAKPVDLAGILIPLSRGEEPVI